MAAMRMSMAVSVSMIVSVRMPMMVMSARRPHAKEIDAETDTGHQQELLSAHLWRMDTDVVSSVWAPNSGIHERTYIRCIPSNTMKIEIRIKNKPLRQLTFLFDTTYCSTHHWRNPRASLPCHNQTYIAHQASTSPRY
jgi:hypothetical protein